MNIVFVVPPFINKKLQYIAPPLGILRIMSLLDPAVYVCKLIDFPLMLKQKTLAQGKKIYEQCVKIIAEAKPDLVAFTSVSITFSSVLSICKDLKKYNPSLPIVVGGSHVSLYANQTLKDYPFIDYVIRGDGEIPFKSFCETLRNSPCDSLNEKELSKIPGLCFRNNNEVVSAEPFINRDLDQLPDPYEHFSLKEYKESSAEFTLLLENGRGCGYNCIICTSCYNKGRVTKIGVDESYKEITNLFEADSSVIFYLFDLFVYSDEDIKKFLNLMISAGKKIRWYTRARIEKLTDDIIELMHKAGCIRILVNPEEKRPERGEAFKRNRKIDYSKTVNTAITLAKKNIPVTLYFTIGFMDDDVNYINRILGLINALHEKKNIFFSIRMLGVNPGKNTYSSELFLNSQLTKGIDFFKKNELLTPDEEYIMADKKTFSSFYSINTPHAHIVQVICENYINIINYFRNSFSIFKGDNGDYDSIFKIYKDYKQEDSAIEYFYNFIRATETNKAVKELLDYEFILYALNENIQSSAIWVNEYIYVRSFHYDITSIIKYCDHWKTLEEIDEAITFYLFIVYNGNIKISKIPKLLYTFLLYYSETKNIDTIISKVNNDNNDIDLDECQEKCRNYFNVFSDKNFLKKLL